ncbi:MAG: hypothetical protein AAGN82_08735 [Myxococcota bacterium]
MTSHHVIYIPLVALLGLSIGYAMGARSVRAEFERRRNQLKE